MDWYWKSAFSSSACPGNLVLQDRLIEPDHYLPFADALAQHQVELHDLLADTAVDRHFGDGLDGSFAGKAFGLYGALEIPVLHPGGLLFRNGGRFCLDRRKGSRLAGKTGGKHAEQADEYEIPIHTA